MVVVFLGQPDGRSCWPWWRLGFPPNHRISGGDGILFLFDFFVRRLMGICSVYSALDIRYRIRIGKVRRHVDQLVVSQKSTQTARPAALQPIDMFDLIRGGMGSSVDLHALVDGMKVAPMHVKPAWFGGMISAALIQEREAMAGRGGGR